MRVYPPFLGLTKLLFTSDFCKSSYFSFSLHSIALYLAEPDASDGMIITLLYDQVGSKPCG